MPQVQSFTNCYCRASTSAKEVIDNQTGIVVRQGGDTTSAESSERHAPGAIVYKLSVQGEHICEVVQAPCSRCNLLWTTVAG